MTTERVRCLMLGVGGPTFITDWARAVSTFADVVGVNVVRRLPAEAVPIGRGMASMTVEGIEAILVRAPRLRPSR